MRRAAAKRLLVGFQVFALALAKVPVERCLNRFQWHRGGRREVGAEHALSAQPA